MEVSGQVHFPAALTPVPTGEVKQNTVAHKKWVHPIHAHSVHAETLPCSQAARQGDVQWGIQMKLPRI
jgi:hypothetical protein